MPTIEHIPSPPDTPATLAEVLVYIAELTTIAQRNAEAQEPEFKERLEAVNKRIEDYQDANQPPSTD